MEPVVVLPQKREAVERFVAETHPPFEILVDEKREIVKAYGVWHRIGLDAVASASLGIGKTGDGLDAIRWWREGRMMDIAEYCCFDVKCTKLVHEFGATNQRVHFQDKFKQKKSVPVEWKV